jgi:hypothetical protein
VVVAPVADAGRGWNDRSHIVSYHGSHAPVHYARSCTSRLRRWMSWWGPTRLPVAPEGLMRPSDEAEVCQWGRALPCLRRRGRAR